MFPGTEEVVGKLEVFCAIVLRSHLSPAAVALFGDASIS